MQSHLLQPSSETRTPRQRFEELASAGFHCFSFEASIQSDVRRLVQTLTVPEYIEAWIALPGEMPGCSTTAARNNDDFAIEHSCNGRASILISGQYRASRRRHIAFSWRVEGDLRVPETEVEIRLRGDFERTTVLIRHSGFASRHDFAWHGALWRGSMVRLAALYGSSGRDRDGSETAKIA